jgi:hypothetical protein
MSETVYHSLKRNLPTEATFDYTADNTFIKNVRFEYPVYFNNLVNPKDPSLRKKGFNRQFRPKLQSVVPALKKLTREDLEDLIGERNTDPFDNV